jgi:hypothetical protein
MMEGEATLFGGAKSYSDAKQNIGARLEPAAALLSIE